MAKLAVAKVFGPLDCGRNKVLPITFKVLPPLSKHFLRALHQMDKSDKSQRISDTFHRLLKLNVVYLLDEPHFKVGVTEVTEGEKRLQTFFSISPKLFRGQTK